MHTHTHVRCRQAPHRILAAKVTQPKLCQRFTARALQPRLYAPHCWSPGFTASVRQHSQGFCSQRTTMVWQTRSCSPRFTAKTLASTPYIQSLAANADREGRAAEAFQPRSHSHFSIRRPCRHSLAAEAQQPLPYSQAFTTSHITAKALQPWPRGTSLTTNALWLCDCVCVIATDKTLHVQLLAGSRLGQCQPAAAIVFLVASVYPARWWT